MAFRKSSVMRFDKILIGALGLLFGIVGLVIAYQAVKTSTEQRSKAALEKIVYKQWEFVNDVEGWQGGKLGNLSAAKGMLIATIGTEQGNISNSTVNTTLPIGNKYIELRLSAKPKITVRSAKPFIFSLSYWTEGEPTGKPPKAKALFIKGTASAKMNNYVLQIPEIRAITIKRIWIGFNSGVTSGDQVTIDSIKLTGSSSSSISNPTGTGGIIVCTLEAKLCPDGSSVGRVGPNCEFAPCPVSNSGSVQNNPNSNPPVLPTGTPQVPPGFYRVQP